MRGWALTLGVIAGLSSPGLAEDQPAEKTQSNYAPRLGDIMIATQLSHFKLWYAGRVANWELAKYEFARIKAAIADAPKYYPNSPMADMKPLSDPVEALGKAIESKDGAKFAKAFEELTSACNSCHNATGFGYVMIREPRLSPIETSPFSDQQFSPK
jgi:hypothetical protein